jgi:antitoxin component of MazEF toxin-antitoxin module
MEPKLARARKTGNSYGVVIPKQIWEALSWKSGDVIALRLAGEKLILERVALDKLAVLRGPGLEGLRP